MTPTTSGRILPLLQAVRRRVRALIIARSTTRGACAGLAATFVFLLLSRFLPIPHAIEIAVGLVAVGCAAGIAYALTRPLPIARMAALVDAGAGLRERVTTALELEATAGASPFTEPIIRQAEEACARVRAADIVPATLPRDLRLVAAGALLCIGASLIPPLGPRAAAEDDVPAVVDAATTRKLEMRARRLVDEARTVKDADAERVGRQMEALARDLEKQRVQRREALARITDQKEKLERQAESRKARQEVKTRLESSEAREVLKAAEKGGEEAARKEAEKLASKLLGDEDGTKAQEEAEEARRELRDELQQMARAAKADPSLHEKAKDALGALDQASQAGQSAGQKSTGSGSEGKDQKSGQAKPEDQKAADQKRQESQEAKQAAKERLAKALKKLADASAEPQAGSERTGEVGQEELAEAFDSLEQARARISGSEPRPTPDSMRRPKGQQAAKRDKGRVGEKEKQGEQQGKKDGERSQQQQQQQQARGGKQSQRHDHPQGGT